MFYVFKWSGGRFLCLDARRAEHVAVERHVARLCAEEEREAGTARPRAIANHALIWVLILGCGGAPGCVCCGVVDRSPWAVARVP